MVPEFNAGSSDPLSSGDDDLFDEKTVKVLTTQTDDRDGHLYLRVVLQLLSASCFCLLCCCYQQRQQVRGVGC